MIDDSILGQLGCIDPALLRKAYSDVCATGEITLAGFVFYTLAIETWLQIRSGRQIASTDARKH